MKKGFTLIELLIVIAILALLMSIIIVTLNPAELLKKSRDTKRVSDLNALRTAINLYVTDKSAPDLDIYGTCGTNTWFSLSGNDDCTALANHQCTTTNRLTTGSGWIPINFGSISSGSPLAACLLTRLMLLLQRHFPIYITAIIVIALIQPLS